MYVTTRVKQEVKEVNTARTRLDATLQSLVDKKDDSNDSTLESDDDDDGPVMISVPVVRSSGSPAASPSKRAGQLMRARKRKRKLESIDATDAGAKYHQTSYVMKLFDRSVDLASFNEKTPLYPIARAWINNKTPGDEEEKPEEPKEEEKDPNCLYKMPVPLRLKLEVGPTGDLRIPPPPVSDDEPLDIHKDPDLGPAPEELLLTHMERWKTIRQSWIQAARTNELRYNNSMIILKDMFEQNLQEQNQSNHSSQLEQV